MIKTKYLTCSLNRLNKKLWHGKFETILDTNTIVADLLNQVCQKNQSAAIYTQKNEVTKNILLDILLNEIPEILLQHLMIEISPWKIFSKD